VASGAPTAGIDHPPLLALRTITKVFPGVRALDAVDFALRAGQIHALLGQNGAGKSTLIKVLTGVYRRDAGDILLDGRPIHPRSPAHAQTLGISTVYQEVNLIPHLSVAENIFLGRQPTRFGRIAWREIYRQATASLGRLELEIDVTQPLSSYSIATQQMVAIARALDVQARLLILDEPTSSLDATEVEQLFAIMRRLKADGLGILFITHFLDQVYAISDRLTVLRNGRLVGEYETASLPRLELIAKMLGEGQVVADPGGRASRRAASSGPQKPEGIPAEAGARKDSRTSLLRATHLGRRGAVNPLDLQIASGETVGLAGLLGSGRTETARLLFGIDQPTSGRIEIDGRPVTLRSPRQAIAQGLGFCPEDRQREGLIPRLSVRENIILALQARKGWAQLAARTQQQLADHYIRSLNIATPDAEKPVEELSGGNQQKVILARWLASQPRLLILDEPTRGIDVGAKAEIETLVRELCQAGLAVLFISAELEEVTRNCDRALVLRDRTLIGELGGAQLDVPTIMRLIAARQEHA
jgi:monosaccharide-transporting ATPase